MTTLLLSDAFRAQIAAEARAAFPRECCGLIEGINDGDVARATALHPARNLSRVDDCFEIDPTDHFRAQRTARATGRAIIGCYHSHPNGRAEPSARDGDSEDGFLWLIAAVNGAVVVHTAFRRAGGGWKAVELVPQPAENGA